MGDRKVLLVGECVLDIIQEVEKIVQVPVVQERVVEVEVIKNLYHEVEKVVEKIV